MNLLGVTVRSSAVDFLMTRFSSKKFLKVYVAAKKTCFRPVIDGQRSEEIQVIDECFTLFS